MQPTKGLLTFQAEGNDVPGSPYFSRRLHWPGNRAHCADSAAGVTIGRGFDLGRRTHDAAYSMLVRAQLPARQAHRIAQAAGLKGCAALAFVNANREIVGDITHAQERLLFDMTFAEHADRARAFYDKYKSAGATSWERMPARMQDVFIDMIYQGAMRIPHVRSFERGNIADVISLIRSDQKLMAYEGNRQRIAYLHVHG